FDLSVDAQRFLLAEQGAGAGDRFGMYLRALDGSPAIRLGDGWMGVLSPDGRSALAMVQDGQRPRMTVLPTGAGEPKPLPTASLSYLGTAWFPDGKRIAFTGIEPGHLPRLYAQDIAGGEAKPFTAEGAGTLQYLTISPDGKWAATIGAGNRPFLFPTAGGSPSPVPSAEPGDLPMRFSDDGRTLFAARPAVPEAQIVRLDVLRGGRSIWQSIRTRDPGGIIALFPSAITQDGRNYLSIYCRVLSDLYLVDGLK